MWGKKAIRREISICHWFLKLVVSEIDKSNNKWWFYTSFLFYIVVIILKIQQYMIRGNEKTEIGYKIC